MEVTIEKNVPIPARVRTGKSKNTEYQKVLTDMEAGDSFSTEKKKYSSFKAAAKFLGVKITTRKDGDTIRIWKS